MLSRIQSDGLSYRGFATSEELSTLIADDLAVLLSERFDLGNQPKEAGRPSRPLPSPASRFIGREREKSIVRDLLTGDLWIAGLLSESVDVVQQALVDEATLSAAERAHARLGLGMLAFGKGDYERAAPALETAIELYSQLGDIGHVATASVPLGVIQAVWAPNGGEDLLSQAADTFRELDDQWGLAFATLNLGGALLLHHRYADAIPYLESASRLPAR
jgi:tetratricopeptide (TPR) repeat protein